MSPREDKDESGEPGDESGEPGDESGEPGDESASHAGRRRRTPADTSLLLDVMLGSLARHLRMCGYDAAYALDRGVEDDDAVLALARAEGRVLVTRDVQLAERADQAVCLTSREVDDQLRELHEAGFVLELGKLARCSRCNGRLERVPATDETPAYAPNAAETAVWRCVDCDQCYWRGSHWDDVADRLPETGEETDEIG